MTAKGTTIYTPYKSQIKEMAKTMSPGTIGAELGKLMNKKKIGSSEITRVCIMLDIETPHARPQMGRTRKVTKVIRRFPDVIKPSICSQWVSQCNDNRNALRAYP